MGLLGWLGVGKQRVDFLAGGIGIASPFAERTLTRVVASEIFGADLMESMPLDRSIAICIPAVSKARNLLISSIAKFPLSALDESGAVADQPRFLSRTETGVTPYERIAWTIDDLIFYGVALWLVERDSDDVITKANYCPNVGWSFDNEGRILVQDKLADESEVILFNSPFEGLLAIASNTLRGARDIEKAWVARVRNPIPAMTITSTDSVQLEQDEVSDLLADWRVNLRNPEGAIGYIGPGLALETHGETDPVLFVEGRNASRTDIGSFLNIPVAMLDGTIGVDSLTYSTTEGNRNRFLDESVPFWTDPIEARLSMDDVVPDGQRVRFDKTEAYALIPNPTDAPEKN